jgi:hypothetical protein
VAWLSLEELDNSPTRFWSEFSQHQQRQEQGQRRAFALVLAPISDLFKRTVQGGRIDGQRFSCLWFSTLKYTRGTSTPFLAFIGVFLGFLL